VENVVDILKEVRYIKLVAERDARNSDSPVHPNLENNIV
jgi:hypothetical protein